VHPDQVVCGAGSDDILEIIIRAFHLSAVITASPTFSMYAFLARLNVPNVPLVDVPRNAASFALDVNGLVAAIRAHANEKEKIPLVFLASPNNPTGTYLTHGEAKELLKERCILVIDEAYIEFSEQEGFQSSVSLLKDHPNLIVTRTLSKWAGDEI
jgi:histidinol-phosphate aminotransferase